MIKFFLTIFLTNILLFPCCCITCSLSNKKCDGFNSKDHDNCPFPYIKEEICDRCNKSIMDIIDMLSSSFRIF